VTREQEETVEQK